MLMFIYKYKRDFWTAVDNIAKQKKKKNTIFPNTNTIKQFIYTDAIIIRSV